MPTVSNDDAISAAEINTLADAMGCRTQTELAHKLGISQPRVSQILSGTHPVKKGTLMQFIRTLQATHLNKKVNPPFSAKPSLGRVRPRTPKRRSRQP